MSINSKQVGKGKHYCEMAYQTWDFINDHNVPYILGLAIKYIVRHRKKNGAEDLLKAIHCLEKCKSVGVEFDPLFNDSSVVEFCEQLHPYDRSIFLSIANNEFNISIVKIHYLLITTYEHSFCNSDA